MSNLARTIELSLSSFNGRNLGARTLSFSGAPFLIDKLLILAEFRIPKTGVKMIKQVGNETKCVVGDLACDSREIYDAAKDVGANVVVPPTKGARVNKNGSKNRKRTVRRIKKLGRRRWKKEAGYHRQGKVENTFFRYKTIIGGRLRSRCHETQETGAMLACKILNIDQSLLRLRAEMGSWGYCSGLRLIYALAPSTCPCS